MPAPTNTSFLTATAITLPASVSQQMDDAGVNFTLYYSFVAPSTANVMIGAFGRVDLVTSVVTTPYIGPASAPTQLLSISGNLKPIQFPVTAGETYFLECDPGLFVSSPTTLLLDVEIAPTSAVPVGSFAVNDDTAPEFPLSFLSGTTDYEVLKFIHPFPFGEGGDSLVDGTVLLEDFANTSLALYNSAMQEIVNTPLAGSAICAIRTCLGGNKFYIGLNTNPTKLYTMTGDGTLSGPEILAGMTSCTAVGASNDETILYHAFNGNNVAVRTWNLVTHAAGANLVAAVPNYQVTDILVLGDDTIVVGYYKSTVTRDFYIKRFNAAGTTLNTYTFATPAVSASPRLTYAIDDPVSFWVMFQPESDHGIKQFFQIQVSDGTVLTTRNHVLFQAGVYQGSVTLTPPGEFGAAPSCPFWITRGSIPTTQTFTIRRQRRWLAPTSPDHHFMQIPTLEILQRTGIGLTPGDEADPPVQGSDPQVMYRFSKDGGKTWTPERWTTAGEIGRFKERVRFLRATGNYRDGVFEITVSDPVDWQFLAAMGDPKEGTS